MPKIKSLLFFIVFAALIIGAMASGNAPEDNWYKSLNKSSLNPPGYIFGIVWPFLYLLMSISAYRSYDQIKKLFFVQLFFNTLWSWLFFSFHLTLISLIDIILLLIINLRIVLILFKVDKLGLTIYLPYFIWLIFAMYFNFYIVLYN